jgi:toxin YoeB
MYKLLFSKQARKDGKNIKSAHLEEKCEFLLSMLGKNPFFTLPPYEKLVGELHGFYSRRINIHHRLVYEVDKQNKIVKILHMWTHYEYAIH